MGSGASACRCGRPRRNPWEELGESATRWAASSRARCATSPTSAPSSRSPRDRRPDPRLRHELDQAHQAPQRGAQARATWSRRGSPTSTSSTSASRCRSRSSSTTSGIPSSPTTWWATRSRAGRQRHRLRPLHRHLRRPRGSRPRQRDRHARQAPGWRTSSGRRVGAGAHPAHRGRRAQGRPHHARRLPAHLRGGRGAPAARDRAPPGGRCRSRGCRW
jgi:hypothetical protein